MHKLKFKIVFHMSNNEIKEIKLTKTYDDFLSINGDIGLRLKKNNGVISFTGDNDACYIFKAQAVNFVETIIL